MASSRNLSGSPKRQWQRGKQESEECPWVLLQLGIIKQKPSVLRFVIKPIRPSVLWLEVRGHVTTKAAKQRRQMWNVKGQSTQEKQSLGTSGNCFPLRVHGFAWVSAFAS